MLLMYEGLKLLWMPGTILEVVAKCFEESLDWIYMEVTVRLHIIRYLPLSNYFYAWSYLVMHMLKRVKIWKKITYIYSQEENAVE